MLVENGIRRFICMRRYRRLRQAAHAQNVAVSATLANMQVMSPNDFTSPMLYIRVNRAMEGENGQGGCIETAYLIE